MKGFAPPTHTPVEPPVMATWIEPLINSGGIRHSHLANVPILIPGSDPARSGLTEWPYLLIVLGGEMHVGTGAGKKDEWITLQANEAILYSPNSWATINIPNSCDFLRITIIPGGFQIGRRKVDRNIGPPESSTLHLCQLERPLAQGAELSLANALSGTGRWPEAKRIHSLNLLLLDIWEQLDQAQNDPAGKAHTTFRTLQAFVEVHGHEAISRENVARAVGIAPRHVSRLYAQFTNESFQQHVDQVRIRRAKSLLNHSEEPIKAIARICGFADVGYFCRVFRARTGSTPGAYRRLFIDT